MTGMIPADHFRVSAVAQFLGVSERRVREVIERGEMAAVRVGHRSWAIPPGGRRRVVSCSPTARSAIDERGAVGAHRRTRGWRDGLVLVVATPSHPGTHHAVDPRRISDAVSQRGPMPEAMRGTWRRQPDLTAFEYAEHPDPEVHRRGLAGSPATRPSGTSGSATSGGCTTASSSRASGLRPTRPPTACCRSTCPTGRSDSTRVDTYECTSGHGRLD